MLKKTLPLAIIGLSTVCNFTPASAVGNQSQFLRVVNNWFEPVQVHEGWVLRKTDYVPAGRTIEWTMYSGGISDLLISYFRDGRWQPILGCPYGSYSYGMTVNIFPAPFDASTPVCQQYANG